MKTSIFTPLNTSSAPGGSIILDRVLGRLKQALDLLASGIISNVVETNGVWLVTPGPAAPTTNPPKGSYYAYIDPLDNKWKSRGANGTVTILGAP